MREGETGEAVLASARDKDSLSSHPRWLTRTEIQVMMQESRRPET